MNNWLKSIQPMDRIGHIEQCLGLKLVANGPPNAFIGEVCEILNTRNQAIMHAEVIGFAQGNVFLMPFTMAKIHTGLKVRATGHSMAIPAGEALLGRIIDAFAQPLDTLGDINGSQQVPLHKNKINPLHRQPIQNQLLTGIHAIDALLPLGEGQRIGIFAGSGVGKSVLLGMMVRQITSDINVIALIGERGREVNDFIQQHLDKELFKKSVVVVACSDEPALMRKQAVLTATAVAEYFCSKGKKVALFMDSMTRFAMAQREISLSLGEPPTTRGYTPTVFSLLPSIVERAGNFVGQGSITALYTVLVEGDDFNEPIADHMRALLDGHIILTRALAQRGHYPAIDVLQSTSRLAMQLLNQDEQRIVDKIVSLLSLYQQNKDMIEIGAYKPGNNPKLDYVVARIDAINQLLVQKQEALSLEILLQRFSEILQ
ncbi:FliI/YscN family ATPase [Legionella maceachernii]|uniref:protein-secreting ATPase n=1 Tax=Legionella maceachernii TaxID=466 RepID=A0A0W0W0C4_9GAMM|nr:FliI/YscN family ATPase [Legionella maceachernii]KTD25835.1 nucleotide binding protein FliI [Legionella maceachernii]SJZ46597.1 type III secretion system ATPase, FliI/YscN [Legionella maceachernii]SUP03985.1 Probable ATP synthase YscN [Legionella maceachernii]